MEPSDVSEARGSDPQRAMSADEEVAGQTVETRLDQLTSVYRPLSTETQEIRLLRLLPDAEELSCELLTVSLLSSPQYECISYCWGDPAVTIAIKVDGTAFQVTTNLAAALSRFAGDAVLLWADALCINQRDSEERNAQVAMMKVIYSQAAKVRVWLECSEGELQDLVRALQALPSGESLDEEAIMAFSVFFQNPYWTRVWVLQELALAKEVVIYYGQLALGAPAGLFGAFYNGCRRLAIGLTPTGRRDLIEMLVGCLDVLKHLAIAEQMVEGDSKMAIQVQGRQCTLRHDYVHGMLGLLDLDVAVDYSQSWEHVWAEYTFKLIQKDVGVLRYAMTIKPSWVVDLSTPLKRGWRTFVSEELYDACPGTAEVALRKGLVIQGFFVGDVTAVAEPEMTFIVEDGEKRFMSPARMKLDAAMRLCSGKQLVRTLCLDRNNSLDSDCGQTKAVRLTEEKLLEYEAALDAVVAGEDHYTMENGKILNASFQGHEGTRLVDVHLQEGLMFTVGDRPGMGCGMRVGDQVVLLKGARTPYAVRAAVGGYELACQCYVDGIMDGEAADGSLEEIVLV